MKCSSLTPHLFYPRRVLMLTDKTSNKKTQQLFDTITGREREGCFLPVNLQATEAYNSLAQKFPSAILLTEHRFDQNQATINLLLKARHLGAKIVDVNKSDKATTIQFNQKPTNYFAVIIDHKWMFANDIRYSNKNFTATLQALNNKTILHIYLHNTHISGKLLQKEISSFLTKLQISTSEEVSNITPDLFQLTKNENIIENTSVNSLQESFRHIKRELRKSGIVLPSASKLFSEHRHNQMTQSEFRELQRICDEKFDLAKQSNVEYQHFARLYYRYPEYIDEMTEKAYEMLNKTRDGKKIWNQIEAGHLENIKSHFTIK